VDLKINGERVKVPDAWKDGRLLWFLREYLGLVGSKFGCGVGACGACTVHVDGVAQPSCSLPITEGLEAVEITTIEGLAKNGGELHPVQQAWIDASVPQCGYCQAGQIMSAVALLAVKETPTDAEIDRAMSGNLCRCGTYNRIRRAIHTVAEEGGKNPVVPS